MASTAVQVAQAFQWTVDSGLAVFPPDATPPAAVLGATPPALPPGGELSAYAVLQWAWLTKNSWRRKVRSTIIRPCVTWRGN